jgi:cell division control protein 12
MSNNPEDLPNMTSLPPPATSSSLPGTGIANLPNQRHKIVAKNGANFTIMVCGESCVSLN